MYYENGPKESFWDKLGLWIALFLIIAITVLDIEFLIWFIPRFIKFLFS